MRKTPVVLAALLATVVAAQAAGAPAKVLVESDNHTLNPRSRPGPAEKLQVHVTGPVAESVVVVPLTRDGKLPNGWKPQVVTIPEEWGEAPAVLFPWQADTPFTVFIVYIGTDKDLQAVKTMSQAMATADTALADLQAHKLQQTINTWLAAHSKYGMHGGTQAEAVGALKRGTEWQQRAGRLPLTADGAGVAQYSWGK